MNSLFITLLCVFSYIGGIIYVHESEILTLKRKKRFFTLAIVLIITTVIDQIGIEIQGILTIDQTIHKLQKAFEFSLLPFIAILGCYFIMNHIMWNKTKKYLLTITFANLVLEITSIFYPITFLINEENNYVRLPGGYIYLGALFTIFVFFLVGLVISARQMQTGNIVLIIYILGLLLLGLILREIEKDSNYDFIAISISYFLFLLNTINISARKDRFTGLLNRQTYEHMLSKINYTTGVIMIDANKLKVINDTLGHKVGDKLLQHIASILVKVYGKHAFCFHLSGDEFFVLLKKNSLNTLSEKYKTDDYYAVMTRLLNECEEAIKKEAEKIRYLKFGISQGFGIYYSNEEDFIPEESINMDIYQVVRYADKRMYEEKEKKHTQLENDITELVESNLNSNSLNVSLD